MDWKIDVIAIPVSDICEAMKFYEKQLGFRVDFDYESPSDDYRLVLLTPPGSTCSISLGTRNTNATPGSLPGIQLSVTDIVAARATLLERGVAVSVIQHMDDDGVLNNGSGGPGHSLFFFIDPDGNGWEVRG